MIKLLAERVAAIENAGLDRLIMFDFNQNFLGQCLADGNIVAVAAQVQRPAKRRFADGFDAIAEVKTDFIEVLPNGGAAINGADGAAQVIWQLGQGVDWVASTHG